MSDPARGGLRLARLGVLVLACLGLGAGGHAVGGGGVPEVTTLALAVPPLTLLGLWFTRRERGVAALFAMLTGVQAALHVGFHVGGAQLDAAGLASAWSGHVGHAGYAGHVGHAGHALAPAGADPGVALSAAHAIGAGHDAAALWPSGPMTAAHLLAIGLTAVALGWGERSLWALARRLLPTLPRAAHPPRALPAYDAARPPLPARIVDLLRLAPVRGPPAAPRPA